MAKQPAPFPSREQILEFVRTSDGAVGKREIARAFHLNVEQKRELKHVLRAMQADGVLDRGRGRKLDEPGRLPNVLVLEITGVDEDGDVLASPLEWDGDEKPPAIYVAEERGTGPGVGTGRAYFGAPSPLRRRRPG